MVPQSQVITLIEDEEVLGWEAAFDALDRLYARKEQVMSNTETERQNPTPVAAMWRLILAWQASGPEYGGDDVLRAAKAINDYVTALAKAGHPMREARPDQEADRAVMLKDAGFGAWVRMNEPEVHRGLMVLMRAKSQPPTEDE